MTNLQRISDFDEQTDRIRAKLDQARRADRGCNVFGASSHRYRIGPPIDLPTVAEFERRHGITLPPDYVAFLTRVGNGSGDKNADAAGPFYGISPLEKTGSLDGSAALSKPALIHDRMSDEEWAEASRNLHVDGHDVPAKAYFQEYDRLLAGVLTIGDQGCENYHGLIVTGPDKGRVVNFTTEGDKPRFAFEANFLDWYERWLDEVISGILIDQPYDWFGYTMGGDDRHLMRVFDTSTDTQTKREALVGLLKLSTAAPETCERLDRVCEDADPDIAGAALDALTKFDIDRARRHLLRLVDRDNAGLLAACQAVLWYAKPSCHVIAPQLLEHLERISDIETFSFALLVLAESGVEFADAIVPFAHHSDAEFRQTTFFHLGKVEGKERYIAVFLAGLRDEATPVVHATLQALTGVTDAQLLPAFREVAARYPTEEGHVRVNLGHLLRDHGYSSIKAFQRGEWARPRPGLQAILRKLLGRG